VQPVEGVGEEDAGAARDTGPDREQEHHVAQVLLPVGDLLFTGHGGCFRVGRAQATTEMAVATSNVIAAATHVRRNGCAAALGPRRARTH